MLAKLIALIGLLVTPAMAQQVTPSFGLESSGRLRDLSVRDPTNSTFVPFGILDTSRHAIVTDAVPVEAYGALGNSNGTTGSGSDDTAAIEACVAGRVCSLRPGATYRLMSAIDIPTNGGLIGDKTATLYCDPAGINNTNTGMGTSLNTRYGQNAGCIRLEGPGSDPVNAITNVVLKDFKINWGGNSGNRCCQAISARNVRNMTIDGIEIYNGSAYGLHVHSWQGGQIINNNIHDFSNDTGAEFSGIGFDGDLSSGLESNGTLIANNKISNMLMSEVGYNNTFTDPLLPDGYQPNGIKATGGYYIRIVGNHIDHTGQCIDAYTKYSIISNNTMESCLGGISIKHSNNNNVVANNTIKDVYTWGVTAIGDATDTSYNNLITGNIVENVGYEAWAPFLTPLVPAGTCFFNWTNTKNNSWIGNSCDPGANGSTNWRDDGADRNTWLDNVSVAPGATNALNTTGAFTGLIGTVNGAQSQLAASLLGGDVIPFSIYNRASAADGNAALMEFASSNLPGTRSVVIGDVDKPTTTAHCFTVRTSNGTPATAVAERIFTCLGTVIGTPTGGTNGDMGVGTLNAQGVYLNGTSLGPPTVASTPAPSLTFGGTATGLTTGSAAARSTTRDRQIYFQWSTSLTAKGSSVGNALLSGLPVVAITGMNVPCSARISNMTAGVGDTAISCLVLGNSTTVALYKMVAGVSTQLTDADFTNTSVVQVSGTYITN